MKKITILILIVMTINIISCQDTSNNKTELTSVSLNGQGTFGFDLAFLSQHDSLIVLQNRDGKSKIIVSAKYQAKVFTSTAEGDSGRSFGWVNYKAFEGLVNPHMNAYGGENRLWLGPEGGKFSLFFTPGSPMEFSNWKTPAAIDTEPWLVATRTATTVDLVKDMELTNYAGTRLALQIQRSIKLLDQGTISQVLGVSVEDGLNGVGYETHNTIINKGENEWTEATGVPCLWMLDMFNPSPETVIIVPFQHDAGRTFEEVVTSDYFGLIASDRLQHTDSVLFFKADGKSRGKLGVRSAMAKPIAGSYDYQHKILTIATFDIDTTAKYLNQEWNTLKPTFLGDAVNAYNDGPLADGSQMGPFFEIESVSPAAFLKPGASLTHTHSVFHFNGNEQALEIIAREILGVSLTAINQLLTKQQNEEK